MIASIVIPSMLAALVALCVAIAPLTNAVSVMSGVVNTTDKVATDIKAAAKKHHKHKPATKTTVTP